MKNICFYPHDIKAIFLILLFLMIFFVNYIYSWLKFVIINELILLHGGNKMRRILKLTFLTALVVGPALVFATQTLGTIATTVTESFTDIGELMIAVAYVAGIGFGISAIFKFKQHKDNPTQIPIGTPFALLAVSVLLVFLPSLYKPAGATVFGTGAVGGGFTGAGASSITS